MSTIHPASPANQLVLIAGFGSIGQRHFANLKSLGCRQFVFYRTRQGTLTDDGALEGFPVESSMDAALAHKPTIVVISNPTASHLLVAEPAARSGCDLYIEKPLSHSHNDCDKLADTIHARKLVAMIGCQFRFHPLLVSLRSQIKAGRLGCVSGVRAEWGEYLPQWHPWEDHRKSYSARADLGGGAILTLIHPFDYLYWIFGPVDRVHASVARVPSLETPAGEDLAEITLEFASGIIGQVHLDYLRRPPVHRLQILGDRGRAHWDYYAGRLTWESADGSIENEEVPPEFERNSMFLAAMQHFLDCVADRREPMITLSDGIEVLDIALRAQESAREKYCRA